MPVLIYFLASLIAAAPEPAPDVPSGGSAAPPAQSQPKKLERMTPISEACCKICRSGKACGNSCIAHGESCSKPPGCACDATKE